MSSKPVLDSSASVRGANLQDARKQAQASAERAQEASDRLNGALMRRDPMLVRLLRAYSCCDEANRVEVVRMAEMACRAPGRII